MQPWPLASDVHFATDKLLRLKVSIDTPETVPTIWREIAIRGEANLTELSNAIQASFGWAGIHKHEFVAADETWKATDPQYGPPEFDDSYKNEEEVYLQDVASRVGPAFTYNYDLTDPWAHYVEVLAIEEGVFEHHKTLLLTGAHAGIPEDCGGASGFEEFLEAISNPHDPEHNAMAVWYKTDCPNGSAGYDPELIETDRINKKLASWSPAEDR